MLAGSILIYIRISISISLSHWQIPPLCCRSALRTDGAQSQSSSLGGLCRLSRLYCTSAAVNRPSSVLWTHSGEIFRNIQKYSCHSCASDLLRSRLFHVPSKDTRHSSRDYVVDHTQKGRTRGLTASIGLKRSDPTGIIDQLSVIGFGSQCESCESRMSRDGCCRCRGEDSSPFMLAGGFFVSHASPHAILRPCTCMPALFFGALQMIAPLLCATAAAPTRRSRGPRCRIE